MTDAASMPHKKLTQRGLAPYATHSAMTPLWNPREHIFQTADLAWFKFYYKIVFATFHKLLQNRSDLV